MVGVLYNGVFDRSITSTIGIDFMAKNYEYNNHKIKLQIWDTAGTERFKSIVRSYLRDVHICFIIFDISNRNTWNNVDEWKKDVEKYNNSDIYQIILVGTKSDLKLQTVSEKEIEEKSHKWNCKYYIISSKQDDSYDIINNMFSNSAKDLHQNVINKHENGQLLPNSFYNNDMVNIIYYDEPKNKRCCFQ